MRFEVRALIDLLILLVYWSIIQLPLEENILPVFISSFILAAFQVFLQHFFGLYRSGWQFLPLWNNVLLLLFSLMSHLVFEAYMYLLMDELLSPQVFIPAGILILALIIHRLIGFYMLNPESRQKKKGKNRVLLYGAGSVAMHLLRDLIDHDQEGKYQISAVVDNDERKIGSRLGSYRIQPGSHLKQIVIEQNIREIWFTMPVTAKFTQSVLHILKDNPVVYKVVPRKMEQLIPDIRSLRIEDLIKRPEIRLDNSVLEKLLNGKRILITGAAGSIGREIARQVLKYSPARVVLLDQWEHGVYEIEKEFHTAHNVMSVIADIQNEDRVMNIIVAEKPNIIFHAAAYKHVPLMEINHTEAIYTNVIGTYHILKCAKRWILSSPEARQLDFVNISTDKAVSPENIMGMSKRISELIVYNVGFKEEQRALNTVSVRFGNVLGSSGSVVPLFWEQLKAGGPLTVTDPEMERFFMTIPEAVSLVLHALPQSSGKDILALDMGAPVRIVDLAERLITLAGYKPYKDIKIEFVGLRPGEKLKEELFWTKGSVKTENPYIFRSEADLKPLDPEELIDKINEAYRQSHSLSWWKSFISQFI